MAPGALKSHPLPTFYEVKERRGKKKPQPSPAPCSSVGGGALFQLVTETLQEEKPGEAWRVGATREEKKNRAGFTETTAPGLVCFSASEAGEQQQHRGS